MDNPGDFRVLLCCDSEKDAEFFGGVLRVRGASNGVITRRVASLAELRTCLADPVWELVITTEGYNDLAPLNVIEVACAAGIPAIFCGMSLADEQAESLVLAGASDALRCGQTSRLCHAVDREISTLRAQRALVELRSRHAETERRCDLLLQATAEPIACVVDDRQIHANDAYARIFGVADAAHLAGVPLVDLVARADQQALKELVRVENAWKEYVLGTQTVTALKDVSLQVASGEFMALAGPSGSGKSTLLNLIGCIDTPSRGSVRIDGREVADKTPDELADLRAATIGFIFQTFNLLPVLSAWENVEYPLLQNKALKKAERRERVSHYLALVGLERHMGHRPNELSGGQRQRVAIARALAARPSIVLADEPTANLDHKTGDGILELMKAINQQEGTTFIFSTHDAKVMALADRVVMLSDGEVVNQRIRQ